MASNARNLSKLLGTSTQVPTTALPTAIADLETIGTSLSGGDIAPKNISSNTLTQSFDSNQTVNFNMSDSIDTISPIISVFKEIPQPGVSSKGNWDVNANATNYEFFDEKPISYASTTLTPSATGDGTFTLSSGSFDSADVGKKVVGNSGSAVITSTAGAYKSVTAFADTSAISSWQLFGAEGKADGSGIELTTSSNGFDIANASYDSKSLNASGYETFLRGVDISSDGQHLIITGSTSDDLHYYTLSTAFDVSTASYVNKIDPHGTVPTSCRFSSTGHKVFICDGNTYKVESFDLSTAYDLSTASSGTTSTALTTVSSNAQTTVFDFNFNNDGTKMFSIDRNGYKIHEYTLSTAWDITNLTYVDAYTFTAYSEGFAFSSDGTKLFILNLSGNDKVELHNLSVAFDISTASISSPLVSYDVFEQDNTSYGICFGNNGQKMYIAGSDYETVYQYSTGSITHPYSQYFPALTNSSNGQINSSTWLDINSMTADETKNGGDVFYAVSTDNRTSWGVAKASDGVRKIARNNSGTWQYNNDAGTSVQTGYDFTNFAYDSVTASTGISGNNEEIRFNNDGTKLYILSDNGPNGDGVYQFSLSTAYDISTLSYDSVYYNSTQGTSVRDIQFNADGTKMFILHSNNQTIFRYSLSTAFNVGTASYDNVSLSVNYGTASPMGFFFNGNATKLYVIIAGGSNSGDSTVYERQLPGAYDISSATAVSSFNYDESDLPGSATEAYASSGLFNNDGTKMYLNIQRMPDLSTKAIIEYNLSTAYDLSTVSRASIQSLTTGTGNPGDNNRGLAWNGDGTKLITLTESGNLFRFTSSVSTAFYSSDVGKKVVGNSGSAIITGTSGTYKSVTAFADTSAISSWQLFGAEGKSDGSGISLTASASGAFNVSGASDTGRTGEIAPIMRTVTSNAYTASQTSGAYMKPDGTQFFINYGGASNLGRYIYSVPLTTAYDISTVTSTGAVQGNINTDPSMVQYGGIFISPDGTKLYFTDPDYTNSAILQYNMSTAWAVNTMSLATKKTVTNAYLRVPEGIFFSQDGTKMFLSTINFNINSNGVLHLVRMTLSTAWDLSTAGTAPDTNQYIDMSNVTSNGAARIKGAGQINSDGTKIVFVNAAASSPEFVLIELSTPYDLTTATFTDYSPPGGTGGGTGAFVTQDGFKAYLQSGSTSQNFYHEYDIGELAKVPYNQYFPALTNSSNGQINSSTWLDINSMTADETKNDGDIFYAVSTDNRTSWGVAKGSDGVRKIARNNSGTWQYNNDAGTTVTVGFDLANASYESKSLNVSGYETFLRGVDISSDGQHLIITGSTSDDLHYYTLSTAFDVSTASYVNKIDPHGTVPTSCRFSSTGHKVFICDANTSKVESFDLSTAYDLSTASSGTTSTALTTVSSNAQTTVFDFNFNNDGTKMFSIDRNGYKIHEYTLSTAWDITNLTYVDAYTFTAYSESFAFSSDGTKLFILNQSGNDKVELHNLSVAFDISTASISSPLVSYDVSSQDNTSYGICFGNNGQKMYIAGSDYETVYQYSTGSTTIGYGTSETWVNGTNNNEHATLQQALTSQSFNRMNKAQLDAVADGYHFSQDSADTLDLMIAPYAASGVSPVSDGVTINYDAEALVREAVAGTDYIAEFPSPNRLDIKSLINGNLKIRAQ